MLCIVKSSTSLAEIIFSELGLYSPVEQFSTCSLQTPTEPHVDFCLEPPNDLKLKMPLLMEKKVNMNEN